MRRARLVCASCNGPVDEGRCASCRRYRPSEPQFSPAMMALIAALVTVAWVLLLALGHGTL